MNIGVVKKRSSKNSLYDAGSSNLALCDNLEGWDGMEDKREVLRRREHMYTYGWFILMYGRNQHNIVKQLFSNWEYIKKNKIFLWAF